MKKKELKPVDHSKIAYIDIRKNLYIIPKSLGSASEQKASTPSAYSNSLVCQCTTILSINGLQCCTRQFCCRPRVCDDNIHV